MPSDEISRRFDQLLAVALRLARSAPSGRTALAQLAGSIDPAWIPLPRGREFLGELEAARREANVPLPFDQVQRILRDAWDEPPDRELDALDPEPVLVTPVTQTHRGELEGRPVAVKVLRPGLTAAVRQDLALLESLVAPASAAFPAADVGALLREVRERVLDDLDLEHQGQALRRLHRALRDHPSLGAAAPVTRLTDETVLVRDWVEGRPLSEADPAERDRGCAALLILVVGAARTGLAPADLELDDVLLSADGRTVIADLGASATVDIARIDAAAALLDAFAADDMDGVAAQLDALGWLPADRAAGAVTLAREVLGPFAGAEPVRLDAEAVQAIRDRAIDRPGPLRDLVVAGRIEPPDLWPARGLGQVFAMIAQIGATAPWRELLRAALRDGWEAAPAGAAAPAA